jgi:predicted ATPase
MHEKRNGELREVSGNVVFNDALTSFLYELMRDHLSAGTVEEIVRNSTYNTEVLFTNGWLAKYANHLSEELLNAKTNNLRNILSGVFTLLNNILFLKI